MNALEEQMFDKTARTYRYDYETIISQIKNGDISIKQLQEFIDKDEVSPVDIVKLTLNGPLKEDLRYWCFHNDVL